MNFSKNLYNKVWKHVLFINKIIMWENQDCIFCKIVAGELPCYKLYEDDNYIAFLNIFPQKEGHTLIIPKKHYRYVWDDENIWEYYKVVQKISKALQKSFDTERVVSMVMWEQVPHAHVHLVPRTQEDWHWWFIDLSKTIELSQDQLNEICEKIKKHI